MIEVQSKRVPRGAGGIKITKTNIGLKKSIITIKNFDTMCLAQAIVMAHANINKGNFTKSQIKNGFNGSRKLQEREAIKLHEDAGVRIPEYGSTLEDTGKFAHHLGTLINIIDTDYFNEIIYTANNSTFTYTKTKIIIT